MAGAAPFERAASGSGAPIALLEAVALGAESLLRTPEPEGAIATLLERLGRAADASRAYLFRHRGEGDDVLADQALEWAAPGIEPQIGNPELQGWSYRATGNLWLLGRFAAGEAISGAPEELPEPIRPILRAQAIRSLVLVPMRVDERLHGFVGFDDCRAPRRWSEAEIAALRLGASLIAAALERQRAERALRESEERLRQAARMESWGRFAAGLARDFDSLVGTIRIAGERLTARLGPADPLRPELTELLLAGERAAELTRDLVAFGRQQPARIEPFDPLELVTERLPLLRRIVGDGIAVVLQPGPPVGRALGDPALVEQAIVTLCLDAREALGESGRIELALGRSAAAELEARGVEASGAAEYVQLSLRDDRQPLDPESAARLFEPFYSTERLGRGRGLGLSTAYGAIRQCGGFVFVDSRAESGTTFDLYLAGETVETAARRAPAALVRPAAAEIGEPSGATILLVEDEDLIRSLAEQILVERGYRILSAANASEAIELATRAGTKIDLLLTDIVMPGTSGSDLAQRLVRSYPEMRVLYMSGYSDSLIFRYGVLQERSAFLQKPFSADVLERKVKELLAP
jgi:signal transduction histidine kinase/CheY-like chemotaxis protein